MTTVTAWDVRVVNATNLAVIAYIPNWTSLDIEDLVGETGQGRIEFDYDEPWVASFKTANGDYPWEGNYAVQVHRSGTLVFTFLVEESEIEYAGARRRATIGGRGIAACLEWAVVIPEKYDEAAVDSNGNSDPDGTVGFMNRAFGSTHTVQADLEAQAGQSQPDHGAIGMPESSYGPKYKAYGGGAFVHLFNEADTGNAATTARWLWSNSDGNGTPAWTDVTLSTLPGGGGGASRNGDPVDWPLSLATNLSEQKDSNNVNWDTVATYPALDLDWLFEIPSGQDMLKTIEDCALKTANSQWWVAPDGKIYIAKVLGTDRSATMMLTVPNAVRSANSFRRTDLRTSMFISNGYAFEKVSDATSESTYGRREAFVQYDGVHGESKESAARTALNEVKNPLDEFSFRYIETDTTQAWLDFGLSDMVRLEYEAGVYQDRQVVGITARISPDSFEVEITIGDLVDNLIAQLKQEEDTEQYTWQITQGNVQSSAKPGPPINIVGTPGGDGLSRFVDVTFDQPKGWENEIKTYEAEVYPTLATSRKFRMSREPERGQTDQTIKIQGVGTSGGEHVVRARSVSKLGFKSEWHTGDNITITAADSDDIIDGSTAPADVSNIQLYGMLNAILVKFDDLNDTSDDAMAGNRGFYEIQISNAPSGGFNATANNSWTQVIQSQTSGWDADDAQSFVVPSGKGFICSGLKSGTGTNSYGGSGRRHFVRIRAVNWSNVPAQNGDGSDRWSVGSGAGSEYVDLDLANTSQLGVIIGEDSIYADHIAAGTITGTEVQTGSLTTSELSANQTWTNAIKMPTPANPQSSAVLASGAIGDEMTFNLDHTGDMWWGNYDTIANAKAGTVVSGTNGQTSWIDKDGNAQFIGTISTGAGSATSQFASGNAGSERIVIGDGSINPGAGGSSGGSTYLMGFTGNASEALPGHAIFKTEGSYGAAYFVAPRFHAGVGTDQWKYAGLRLKDPSSHTGTVGGTNGEAILVHPGDMDYMGLVRGPRPEGTGTDYAEITGVVTSPGGFRVTAHAGTGVTPGGLTLDSGTPATGSTATGVSRTKLWNDGGTLKWGATAVGGGGSDSIMDHTGTNIYHTIAIPYIHWGFTYNGTDYDYRTSGEALAAYLGTDGVVNSTTYNTNKNYLATPTYVSNLLANYTVTSSVAAVAHPGSYSSSANGSGNFFIQDLTIDAHGHVTNYSLVEASGGGSSGVTSLSVPANWGLYVTGSTGAISIGMQFSNIYAGTAITSSTNMIFEGGLGLPNKTSVSNVVGAGLASGLNMGSTASWAYYTTYISQALRWYTSKEITKQHVTTVAGADALGRIKALRPVNFYFNDKIEPENEMARLQKQRGFVAEEVAAVDPQLASYGWVGDDGVTPLEDPEKAGKTLDDTVPIMYQQHAILADVVAALQQMESRIAALES